MPVNPNGSCLLCKIAEVAEKTSNHLRKHVLKYALIYLLFIEAGSMVIRSVVPNKEYDLFWFPLLVQISFTLIFFNLYLFRKLLKFCQRKNIVVGALTSYYFMNTVSILFPICNSIYTEIITYSLLIIVYVTLLLTIFKNKK